MACVAKLVVHKQCTSTCSRFSKPMCFVFAFYSVAQGCTPCDASTLQHSFQFHSWTLFLVHIKHEMRFGIATRACDLSITTSSATSLRHTHVHRAQERAWGFKESGLDTVRHLGSGVGGSIFECQDHGCSHGWIIQHHWRIIQHDVIHSSRVSAES